MIVVLSGIEELGIVPNEQELAETTLKRLERDLQRCRLCAWECDIDRLAGERGVCGLTLPLVVHSTLHPAPPSSYDAFMAGCNFRCLFCQNWTIAHYPQNPGAKERSFEGWYEPEAWAELALAALASTQAEFIHADRLFFTGGEPTCSLPWVEAVVEYARKVEPGVKVNFDTNGFLTAKSMKRVCRFTTSITFDIKAYNDRTFRALTGAPAEPVLKNVEYIARYAKNKIWEIRIMVIPNIHELDGELKDLCDFLAGLDPTVPVCFLAFRPNFVFDTYYGPTRRFMDDCVRAAKAAGLEHVEWSGRPGLGGHLPEEIGRRLEHCDDLADGTLAQCWAVEKGCVMADRPHGRDCGGCVARDDCEIKSYVPKRSL